MSEWLNGAVPWPPVRVAAGLRHLQFVRWGLTTIQFNQVKIHGSDAAAEAESPVRRKNACMGSRLRVPKVRATTEGRVFLETPLGVWPGGSK
jgi:hypothetical protein